MRSSELDEMDRGGVSSASESAQKSVRDSEDDMAQKTATDHKPRQASNTMVKEIVRDSLPVGSSSAKPQRHTRAWKIGTNIQPAATTTAPTVKKSLRDAHVDFLKETAKFQKVQMAPVCRRAPDVVGVTSSCRQGCGCASAAQTLHAVCSIIWLDGPSVPLVDSAGAPSSSLELSVCNFVASRRDPDRSFAALPACVGFSWVPGRVRSSSLTVISTFWTAGNTNAVVGIRVANGSSRTFLLVAP